MCEDRGRCGNEKPWDRLRSLLGTFLGRLVFRIVGIETDKTRLKPENSGNCGGLRRQMSFVGGQFKDVGGGTLLTVG